MVPNCRPHSRKELNRKRRHPKQKPPQRFVWLFPAKNVAPASRRLSGGASSPPACARSEKSQLSTRARVTSLRAVAEVSFQPLGSEKAFDCRLWFAVFSACSAGSAQRTQRLRAFDRSTRALDVNLDGIVLFHKWQVKAMAPHLRQSRDVQRPAVRCLSPFSSSSAFCV